MRRRLYTTTKRDWLALPPLKYSSGERMALEGFPKGQEPIRILFTNNRDGTFTDVTTNRNYSLRRGQGVGVGRHTTNDWLRRYLHYSFGKMFVPQTTETEHYLRQRKDGVGTSGKLWNTGCASRLMIATAKPPIFLSEPTSTRFSHRSAAGTGPCNYTRGASFECGPPAADRR